MRPRSSVRPLLIALALGSIGCGEKVRDGAMDIFARDNTCPANRLTATERKDVPPHTVLATNMPAPPAEIAADPERLKMWNDQHRTVDIDAFGRTYDVTGCGKTTRYVCAHPRADGRQGPYSADVSVDADGHASISLYTESSSTKGAASVVSDGVVMSSVVCLPAGTSIAR